MSTRSGPFLSKSKLISGWQCLKKLHLEIHRPELGEVSAMSEALFASGNKVGAIAQALFAAGDSVEIPYSGNLAEAIAATEALIESGATSPVFEATFQYDGVLVRVDVLLPDGDAWRAIEVKASTSVKEHHVLDCAIQFWVMKNCGLNVRSIALAHINNQFVYKGNEDYSGLLVEADLTDEAVALESEVIELVERSKTAAGAQEPQIAVGGQCNKPYECQFESYCWPVDAEYPVMGLGGGKKGLGSFVAAGYRDIREVPSDALSPNQQRIHRITSSGEAEVLKGAKAAIAALDYPRYYLDFETIAPAVPFWEGTRPYQILPIQWSCHIADSADSLRHAEFLDLSGEPPMRALAESMIDYLGTSGPILMYTSYERRVIAELIALFPDLAAALENLIERLVDLHPIVKENYYHPGMLGSWSIKAVSPAIARHMDYANLDGINEGMAASEGYLEAIKPETSLERKAELDEQLRRYCRFDTEAMVEIVKFFNAR